MSSAIFYFAPRWRPRNASGGLAAAQRCRMTGDARQDSLVTVEASRRRSRRAVPALWPARVHSVDAAPRRADEAGPSHLRLHRVSDDRRASGARITRRLLLTGLVILAVVAALGLAEIVLRAMARRSVSARSHRYLTSDPVVHHRARAGVSAIVAGTPFVTNSLGLRD